jgi:uncharacterized protein (TIRG00374 family)
MNSRLYSFFKYLILLTIAAALLFFAFKGMDLKKIGQQILHANMLWVALSGLISVIAFIVRAYRWNLLIEPMGYTPSLKNTTYSLMVGYFANLAIPRLGEVSRCGALSKAESIPFNKLLGTVIVERAIDVITLLLCMLFAALIEFKRLGSFFNENIFNPIIKKFEQLRNSPFILGGIIVVLIVLTAVAIYFKRKNKSKGTEPAISKLIKGFIDGLRSVANLKRPGWFIFHSILIWVLYYLGTYVAFFAFPFTAGLGPGAALFLLVASGLGMSAPVQGGIGAYHLLVSQGLMLYGLSKQDGLTFATLLHTLQLLLVILFGIISLILLFSGNKKRAGSVEMVKNTDFS